LLGFNAVIAEDPQRPQLQREEISEKRIQRREFREELRVDREELRRGHCSNPSKFGNVSRSLI